MGLGDTEYLALIETSVFSSANLEKALRRRVCSYSLCWGISDRSFPGCSAVENPAMQETRVRSLGQEDSLEKEITTNSSILAWRIPWTEEPCGL